MTVNRNRDDPTKRTLTSLNYWDLVNMTVMNCIEFCIYHGGHTFAGLENGSDCCECTSRPCLQVVLYFRDFHRFDHTFLGARLWKYLD